MSCGLLRPNVDHPSGSTVPGGGSLGSDGMELDALSERLANRDIMLAARAGWRISAALIPDASASSSLTCEFLPPSDSQYDSGRGNRLG